MITRFLRIASVDKDSTGAWSVRVVLERDDGMEEAAFLKFRGDAAPKNPDIAAEVAKIIQTRNTPPYDPFTDMPDLPALQDIPMVYRQRIWQAFKDFVKALLGRA